MNTLKRSSDFDEPGGKIQRTDAASTDLEETSQALEKALEKNELLKGQLATALKFIEDSHITLEAPPSVQKLLDAQPGASKALARTIETRMRDIHEDLQEKLYDWKKTGVHNDDFSREMVPFIWEIQRLSNMDGIEGLKLAYRSILKLKDYSCDCFDLGDGCSWGDRPSDEDADAALADIIERRLQAKDTWDFASDLKDLDEQAKDRASYGIELWFESSRAALKNAKVPERSSSIHGSPWMSSRFDSV
ncbi:hypothetical protein F5Y15DRAFT_215772 [Xylariaceae sp. FL0016]|nr:hypothetical protein F5Y15DRAFT_215772 [Xylariaceae sp. FL0016]